MTLDMLELCNFTDYLSVHTMLTLFEQDQLEFCIDAVRKENARNYTLDRRSIELS